MNKNIIPQGPREFITGAPTVVTGALVIRALENITFTDLAYIYPKTPASAAVQTGGALLAGQQLEYVASVSVTGDVEVIYLP